MKVYQVHPLTAAIFLCLLSLGVFAFFVALPIAFIQWTWNSFVIAMSSLPEINIWQATLLYLAGATIMYLLGFVRIDLEPTSLE